MPRVSIPPPKKIFPLDWRDQLLDRLNEYRMAIHPPDGSTRELRAKKADTMEKLIRSARFEEGTKELLRVSRVDSLEQIRLREGENGINLLWWVIEQCAMFFHYPTPKEQEKFFDNIRKTHPDPTIREIAADALISLLRSKPKKGPYEKGKNLLLHNLDYGIREKLKKKVSFNQALDCFIRATFGGGKSRGKNPVAYIERQLTRLRSSK